MFAATMMVSIVAPPKDGHIMLVFMIATGSEYCRTSLTIDTLSTLHPPPSLRASRRGFALPSPPEIPDSKITQEITADVVIVGAGLSGLMASIGAAEEGASVVVIEKWKGPNVRGAHINPGPKAKLFQEIGLQVDYERALRQEIDYIAGGKVDEKLRRLWLKYSSDVVEIIRQLAERKGIPTIVLKPKTYPEPEWSEWPRPTYKFSRDTDFDGVAQLAPVLEEHAKSLGVKFYYETTAVVLKKDSSGRVNAVIAKDKAENYVKFKANKGVILCTGDYNANNDLLKAWAPPEVAKLVEIEEKQGSPRIILRLITPTNTGDGQLMGMWVGADIDSPPHCPLCYIMPGGNAGFALSCLAGFGPGNGYMLTCNPFLFVNDRGERFVNEAVPWMYVINRVLQQPNAEYWAVFDSKYADYVANHGGGYRRITDPALAKEFLEGALANGAAVQANSLEELADKMGVPRDTFIKTVNRYNELCDKGIDEDYGKPARYLHPIKTPPFYAVKGIAVLLNMVGGGLKVNENLQVLDKNGNPIPGLYAAGNAAGNFYAQFYSLVVTPGLSHSRAVTFGYLAGKNAVKLG